LEADHDRLENRSKILERRETQVRTAAEISRAISGELNLNQLLSKVSNLIRDHFGLYYVGVFLIDESGLYAELWEGTGDEGKIMKELGHRLPVGGSSMIGWTISNRQARIALDVGREAVRFDNPNLPLTRSELALPMLRGDQVLGALTIQSTQSEAFDEEDILVLQGLTDSLSTAINNANLFSQIESNLQEIQRLQKQYLSEAWTSVAEESDWLSYEYKKHQPRSAPKEIDSSTSRIEKPIVLRDQVIGNIVFETKKPGFTQEENAFINTVVSQAALALDNARLVESTQRSAHQDRIVTDLSRKVWASTDMDTILRTALSEMVKTLDATDGIIHLDLQTRTPDPAEF
jgi:GAF domain-containing protein